MRRIMTAICGAALLLSLGAGAVFAGEITGTGQSVKLDTAGKWGTWLHARSECAYSGQEDLQYRNEDGTPRTVVGRGDPGHAQSWGQIPKAGRDFLTALGFNPGIACNPIKAGAHP